MFMRHFGFSFREVLLHMLCFFVCLFLQWKPNDLTTGPPGNCPLSAFLLGFWLLLRSSLKFLIIGPLLMIHTAKNRFPDCHPLLMSCWTQIFTFHVDRSITFYLTGCAFYHLVRKHNLVLSTVLLTNSSVNPKSQNCFPTFSPSNVLVVTFVFRSEFLCM